MKFNPDLKGTLAETAVMVTTDGIMAEIQVPIGSLQLLNGLWLAEETNHQLCKECIKEDFSDEESDQFEINLINCYTGIPTQDLLEELGDLKETTEVLALDLEPVKEPTKPEEVNKCNNLLAFP